MLLYTLINRVQEDFKPMNMLKAIKILVFIMTFLLLSGSIFLISSIAKRVKNSQKEPPAEINLQEPEGFRIKQIASNKKNLYILISNGENSDYIIIFDTEQGKKISNIKIN